MNTTVAIVPGSLQAITLQNNRSLAETFVSCDVIVLVDTSGSMGSRDSRGGQSRYDVACQELAQLQANLPGKIGVISFSGNTVFCPGGVPTNLNGGTNLQGALEFVKVADLPGMRFIVISDGYPDDAEGALQIARQFRSRIDTIYVGPEEDKSGRDFLARLANCKGGEIGRAHV